jgi:hypothetical protein
VFVSQLAHQTDLFLQRLDISGVFDLSKKKKKCQSGKRERKRKKGLFLFFVPICAISSFLSRTLKYLSAQ